jgi:cellobiose phosphorylase
MASEERAKQAAIRLGQRLSGKPWYSGVGISREHMAPVLIVYSRRKATTGDPDVPRSWEGMDVRVRQIGKIVAAR